MAHCVYRVELYFYEKMNTPVCAELAEHNIILAAIVSRLPGSIESVGINLRFNRMIFHRDIRNCYMVSAPANDRFQFALMAVPQIIVSIFPS